MHPYKVYFSVLTTIQRPRRSTGPVPPRLAGSVRRTSNIDVTWPEGMNGAMRFVGLARDLATPRVGPATVIAEDSFTATVSKDWEINAITSEPKAHGLDRLVGAHASRGFRKALCAALPDEDRPLQLVLSDMPGASLVAGAAWQNWDPDWMRKAFGDLPLEVMLKARQDVCIGHATGSSAQNPTVARNGDENPEAADLTRADDPEGWHAMALLEGVAFRRSRRIDVSCGDAILIDAEFQDSATRPGGRVAIHEYGLTVTADPDTLTVLTIATEPRVLPYRECPSASAHLPRLIGISLAELRETVPVALKGAVGCTHLNEAFRGLAAVPALLEHLD